MVSASNLKHSMQANDNLWTDNDSAETDRYEDWLQQGDFKSFENSCKMEVSMSTGLGSRRSRFNSDMNGRNLTKATNICWQSAMRWPGGLVNDLTLWTEYWRTFLCWKHQLGKLHFLNRFYFFGLKNRLFSVFGCNLMKIVC